MTNTTIQLSTDLNVRIKDLAADRSKKLGLSKSMSQRSYLEMLVAEEEERVKDASKS